jgi:hypothetical protein
MRHWKEHMRFGKKDFKAEALRKEDRWWKVQYSQSRLLLELRVREALLKAMEDKKWHGKTPCLLKRRLKVVHHSQSHHLLLLRVRAVVMKMVPIQDSDHSTDGAGSPSYSISTNSRSDDRLGLGTATPESCQSGHHRDPEGVAPANLMME